jgi:uncharacterized protein (DUF433 family)
MSNQPKKEKTNPFYFPTDSVYFPKLTLWDRVQFERDDEDVISKNAKGYLVGSDGRFEPKLTRKFGQEVSKELAEKLCDKYPAICTNKSVFGGVPHLKGYRLTVSQILARLYVLESVDAVVGYYSAKISPEQVKEAIAYAHDFLQIPYDTETDD